MSPGIGEEIGSTTRATVGALASTPALLVIVLMTIGFAGMITFSVNREREQAHEVQQAVIERCFPLALMEAYRQVEVGDIGNLPSNGGHR